MHSSSIVHLIISILISVLGTLVNVKFLKNMKDEEKSLGTNSTGLIVKRVMTAYTYTLIVSTPIKLIFIWFLYENVELPIWIRYLACYGLYFLHGLRIYHAFNSLVVAAMRYSFVVHHNAVLRFGKEKAKALFYYGSLAIPIMIEILIAFSFQMPPTVYVAAISTCPASYHGSYNRSGLNVNITQDFSLPVYSFVHRYISDDITYYVRMLAVLLNTIIFSNK